MDRRDFMRAGGTIALAAAGAAVMELKNRPAFAQTAVSPAGYTPVPLSVDPKAIAGLSANLITSHYDNNYSGAVRRLNSIDQQLQALDFDKADGFLINGLKREQLMAANSMILHERYFASLGQGGDPTGNLAAAVERDFGSVAKWRSEFSAMGKALGGGSGWVLLTHSLRLGRLINQWSADHTMTTADGAVILALDMYEHAYHMDYGARAAAYVDAFMKVINWPNAAGLYQARGR